MLNWLVRFAPIVRYLPRMGITNVLEVGSGSFGLAEFVSFPVTGCDVSFPTECHERLRPVIGSITALPFDDDAFQCVVCLDTLEHLAPGQRDVGIRELIRVTAKHLIVGCPVGGLAQSMDSRMLQQFRIKNRTPPSWLVEHLENPFPRQAEIAATLEDAGLTYRAINNEPLLMHYPLTRVENSHFEPILNRFSKNKFLRHRMPNVAFGPAYRVIFFAHK